MIFSVIQTKKDLYASEFNILEETGNIIGMASFKGSLVSRDGVWEITLNGSRYKMDRVYRAETAGLLEKTERRKAFRPCRISEEQNPENGGSIFMDEERTGFLTASSIQKEEFCGKETIMYKIGLGEQGFVYPIYQQDGKQTAQVEKPCTVHNMLYRYEGFCKDDRLLPDAVFHTLYLYMTSDYKPGVTVKESKEKRVVVTKGRILEKYDPDFWERER